MSDRQLIRFAAARQRYNDAQSTHREAALELERAAAELAAAGAALSERVRLQSAAAPTFAPHALSGAKHARPVRALGSADGVEHPHNHEQGATHAR